MKKIILILISLTIFSCKKENALSDSEIVVGQSHEGGIVFYIDGTGQHGLIAAEYDSSDSIQWFSENNIFFGATESAVGFGQQNTKVIIDSAIARTGCSCTCGAGVLEKLVLNGYSDWFLPSRAELNLLFQQRTLVGGFSNDYYWTSTEYDTLNAWNQYFPYGPQYYSDKSSKAHIRAIRSF